MRKFSDYVKSTRSLNENEDLQKEYDEVFTALLDKHKVKSPAELSDDDKGKFFDEIKEYYTKGKGKTDKGEDLTESKIINESKITKSDLEYSLRMSYDDKPGDLEIVKLTSKSFQIRFTGLNKNLQNILDEIEGLIYSVLIEYDTSATLINWEPERNNGMLATFEFN